MNIMHVWDGDYPWDVRVEKINDTLVTEKHKVFIACRNQAMKKLFEYDRNVEIHRMPFIKKSTIINSAIGFPFFFNPFWLIHLQKIAQNKKIDLILVRDLPLALSAIWVGNKLKVPVVLDMAENYPLMLKSMYNFEKKYFSNFILRNSKIAEFVEKIVLKKINQVIVVIEESLERLVNMGVDPLKISMVKNTPISSMIHNDRKIPIPEDPFFKDKNRLVVLYNGLTNPTRGVLDLVRQFAEIKNRIPGVRLVINGKGYDDNKIRLEIKRLKLEEVVYHKGWVSHEDKVKYLYHCDIGIIPYHLTDHWHTTIPNKLFDYMSQKKPVLSTKVIPTARIINECKCGFVYEKNDINDLCNKMKNLSIKKEREKLGNRGFKMIISKYNWDMEKPNILYSIQKFSKA